MIRTSKIIKFKKNQHVITIPKDIYEELKLHTKTTTVWDVKGNKLKVRFE